jgi:hypothetical protein
MSIEKVVRKIRLEDQGNDFAYWQAQPYEVRLATLDQIRHEYNLWKYGTEPGFQRVYSIIK